MDIYTDREGSTPSLLSHQLTVADLQTGRQKPEAGRWKWVACYLYLWHPVVSCFVREVVGVVVILPGHKLQVLCFDIRDDVYKFDNIGRGGRRRNGQPKKRSAKRRSAKARVAGTGFFSFRQQKRLAAASLLRDLMGEENFFPLLFRIPSSAS